MDKKGQIGGLMEVIVFSLLAIAVILTIAAFINSGKNGAAYYEKIYSQEIALLIDGTEKGSEVYFDVTPVTKIAFDNGVDIDESISFDNENHRVIVKLRKNGYSYFNYFSDKIIADDEIKELSGGGKTDRLHFFVK